MNRIVEILMKRDDLTLEEAEAQVEECREAFNNGEFDALQVYCQLEDDYIFDLI